MLKTQKKSSWLRPLVTVKEISPPTPKCRCPKQKSSNIAIPCRCDEYEDLGKEVGEGISSRVCLLRQRKTGVVYATKQFKNFSGASQKFATNVLAEYYVSEGLRHPSIIHTHELCTINGALNMVMEYAPQNLLDMSAAGTITLEAAESYFKQLVAGIAYVHTTGFAHRDIKLENVLLKGDHVKIIDFGTISTGKWMPTGTFPTLPNSPTLTSLIADVGSLPYMAPELFTASHYSPLLADVWSLAILYSCMILRRFPWPAARIDKPVYQVYAETLRSENEVCPWPVSEFPANMRSTLSVMLHTDPRQRPMLEGVLTLLREQSKQG